jgi:hypothetical protein
MVENVWMNLPHPDSVLKLFEELSADSGLWSKLRPEGTAFSRGRIYTLGVVVRLMMVQHLLPGGTLKEALQQWLQSALGQRRSDISPNAGPIAGRA